MVKSSGKKNRFGSRRKRAEAIGFAAEKGLDSKSIDVNGLANIIKK